MTKYTQLLKLAELMRDELNHDTDPAVQIPREMIRKHDDQWQWRDLFGEWHPIPGNVLAQLIEQLEKE